MIHSLRLQNFKCFRDQSFDFGKLTLLSGLNGVGKSTVVQSLLLLRQSYLRNVLPSIGLILNGDLIQLGTAQDIYYEGASDQVLSFNLTFTSGQSADWAFSYDSGADIIGLASAPVSDSIFKNERLFSDFFHCLLAERIGPRKSFDTSDYAVRQHHQIGVSGEFTVYYLSLFGARDIPNKELAHPKALSLSLKNQVETWMREISPGVRLEITGYPEMDLVNLGYAFDLGAQEGVTPAFRSTNVGFGITYTLPVLVALLSSPPNSLVILENPEAHLHPKGQFQIGELIARAAMCGVQIVVETHSDHILNGIRVAVHDGILSPENTKLYYLGRNEKHDQMQVEVTTLKIDKNGRIDRWPEGFFDEWEKGLEKLL